MKKERCFGCVHLQTTTAGVTFWYHCKKFKKPMGRIGVGTLNDDPPVPLEEDCYADGNLHDDQPET